MNFCCQEGALSQKLNTKNGVELTTKIAPLLQLTSEGVDDDKEVENCHEPAWLLGWTCKEWSGDKSYDVSRVR
jgi:hypothetical protein